VTTAAPVRVLLLSPDRQGVLELGELLQRARSVRFEVLPVGDARELARTAEATECDVVLCDLRAGRYSSWMREARDAGPDVPWVVIATEEDPSPTESTDFDDPAAGGDSASDQTPHDILAKAVDIVDPDRVTRTALERSLRLAVALGRCETEARTLRFHTELLGAVGQAVTATDGDGLVTFWNAEAERLYGWSAREAVGRPLGELVPSSRGAAATRRILDEVWAGRSWSGDVELRRKDGSTMLAHVTKRPLLDPTGVPVGVVSAARDVTEQRRTEQALRERVKELRTLNRVGFIMNRRDVPVEKRLQQVVDTLPGGWTRPQLTKARITLEHLTVQTEGFGETPWTMSTPIPSSEAPGILEIALTAALSSWRNGSCWRTWRGSWRKGSSATA